MVYHKCSCFITVIQILKRNAGFFTSYAVLTSCSQISMRAPPRARAHTTLSFLDAFRIFVMCLIVTDNIADLLYSRGAFRFSDVVESATTELVSTVQQLQSHIQPDDGCNLQFTSVSRILYNCFMTFDCSTIHAPSSKRVRLVSLYILGTLLC